MSQDKPVLSREWLRPGIWVRNKFAPYIPRAFVMFVKDDGSFKYHFERPYKVHVTDEGWHTGGEAFPVGPEQWEPCEHEAALERQGSGLVKAYDQGFLDGVRAYAWHKDGRQEVGTTGRTLKYAFEHFRETWNYQPPQAQDAQTGEGE